MRYSLKDYQEDAAENVTRRLLRASRDYAEDGELGAVSLSAPTGAGKTVIATAVIERIWFGDPEGVIEPDPMATFLWVTDDPSLNRQTRKKILQASDRIRPEDLVVLDPRFDEEQLPPGRVFFLNVQLLRTGSLMGQRREGVRRFSFWETIAKTIEESGGHYYLIRDEAHRGARPRNGGEQTIAQRLTNGDADLLPAAPVVLGISATPKRFEDAIRNADVQRSPRSHQVPVAQVRESGLIKDTLSIHHSEDVDTVDMTLVREAVRELRRVDERWRSYTTSEGEPEVRPVLVVQLPAAGDDYIAPILATCRDEWSVLEGSAVAHSLESHAPLAVGDETIPYVAPQDIQDHPHVRLVLFKQALSTGWDCPRAEVLLSLAAAQDETYITQLIGRMVRSPLARRILADDRLNGVTMYLPRYDRDAVHSVKKKLDDDDDGGVADVIVNAIEATINTEVGSETLDLLQRLPSYLIPRSTHRSQVVRLHRLTMLLAGDELAAYPTRDADADLMRTIDEMARRLDEAGSLEPLKGSIERADIGRTQARLHGESADESATDTYSLDADRGDIDRMFLSARRHLRDGIADQYWRRLIAGGAVPAEAKVSVIALSRDAATTERVEARASELIDDLLATHAGAIDSLTEDQRSKYMELRTQSRAPTLTPLTLPPSISMSGDADLSSFTAHVYADSNGLFRPSPALGSWERAVLSAEQARAGFLAWYRNPTGGEQRALRVPYMNGNSSYAGLYPDFIVFHRDADSKVVASIIDPHSLHLADASSKLRGLAEYAANHGAAYSRILSVVEDANGHYRSLDLKDAAIQAAIKDAGTREETADVFTKRGVPYA